MPNILRSTKLAAQEFSKRAVVDMTARYKERSTGCSDKRSTPLLVP